MKGTKMKLKKLMSGKTRNRVISLFLTVVMLLSSLPLMALTALADSTPDYRSVDENTMDAWRDYIGKDVLDTTYAGGIFADKSVFRDGEAFRGTGIDFTDNEYKTNFLVALSAIASNMDVTGQASVPTDTVLVLDISGSMNASHNDLAETLVEAANEAMAALLDAHAENRVGVVLYSDSATELLPLDHYTTASDDRYLSYSGSFFSGEYVGIDSDTRTSAGRSPSGRSRQVVGGTYIQSGLDAAADEFQAQAGNTTVKIGNMDVARKPVMVLLTDGEPTYGTTSFADPEGSNLGNGENYSAAIGFVTQLTAAYTKSRVKDVYGSEMLFYTMGLGVEQDDVLDPSRSSTAIRDFWESYDAAKAGETVTVSGRGNNARKVTKISDAISADYVDQYFEVRETQGSTLASGLVEAFRKIVGAIQLESNYFPTFVQSNSDLEGYITFRDKIGHHMNVVDVKGLLLHNTLFSGEEMAKSFVDTGSLGTPENPTELGLKFMESVRARLGIEDSATAATLVALAHEYKQLYWESATSFSNYIGWYADENYNYLGFWHEGHSSVPADIAQDAKYIVRSYGYLGETDEAHGVKKSDMMFTTVRVSHDIASGDETVTFAVPASLIPIVTYHVTCDEDGDLTELTVDGADHPIRLVYEVALADGIDPLTVSSLTDGVKNANGDYEFYTNAWEQTISYDEDNTHAYFTPSQENDRYYYTEPTAVYTNTLGSVYSGTAHPKDTGDTYYRRWTVYKENLLGVLTTDYAYEEISSKSIEYAEWHEEEGHWHITSGHPHTFTADFRSEKGDKSLTGTLDYNLVAFADVTNGYVTGYTLGNNGRLTVTPATGIALSKTVETEAAGGATSFEFTIKNLNSSEDSVYDAVLVKADGTRVRRTVTFADGSAVVFLNGGETLYVTGMKDGESYSVTETQTASYAVVGEETRTVTVNDREIVGVAFINTARGKGDLTVTKEVLHELDDASFADKEYEIKITLQGIGTKNAKFDAEHSGDATLTEIVTDGNGAFTFTLKNGERLEVFGLAEGTVATVTETDPGDGYTVSYLDNGAAGDGIVTVPANGIAAVRVENAYAPAKATAPYVSVNVNKILAGRDWLDSDSFSFRLEKYAADGSWQPMQQATADKAHPTVTFGDVFVNEDYPEKGVYYYRVSEIIPEDRIQGVTYDRTVHSFGVHVDDRNIDGVLEVVDIVPGRETVSVVKNGNEWAVTASFTNTYSATGSATVSIDIEKLVQNPSGSPLGTPEGFSFVLLETNKAVLAYKSNPTTERGFTRMVLSFTEVGTYQYYLKEEEKGGYWDYSQEWIPVTIVVRDNLKGGLEAVIYEGHGNEIPANATDRIAVDFENKYIPNGAYVKIEGVRKELSGRDLNDGEFTIGIYKPGAASPEVSNIVNADGSIQLPPLYLDKVGTHYFEVREEIGNRGGVKYDTAVYRIAVHVTDNNGVLEGTYEVLNQAHDEIVFKNVYEAAPTTEDIYALKDLIGKPLVNDEFHFTMTPSDENGNPIGDAIHATNLASGMVEFPTQTFTEAGTYYFVIDEVEGNEPGIVYDDSKYLVTFVIKDDLEGSLYRESRSFTVLGGSDVAVPSFTNYYVPAPTKAELEGEKTLVGKVLGEGDYVFELYESNRNWNEIGLIERVRNDADGLFSFKALDYNADHMTAGLTTHYYLVKEANGGETIQGVTYDGGVYRVRVDLTDDQMGYLHATVHIFDGDGVPADKIEFVNEYKVTGTKVAVISGEKTYKGGKTLADGLFTFELYEADVNYTAGTRLQTVKNVGTEFKFIVEGFDADDVGESFYYVVKEENAGANIDGVIYDGRSYRVKVSVLDNGDGTLSTKVETFNESGAEADIEFVNEYKVSGTTTAVIAGEKELSGRELEDGEFSFELYEADAAFAAGAKLKTVKNVGKDVIFRLDYDAEDLGKTFYYVVKEEGAGTKLNGVTFDRASYTVKVEILDNGDGTLGNRVTVTEGEILFKNTFEATLDLSFRVQKTVKNIGTAEITPEGFEFVLTNTTTQAGTTEKSDANGVASFDLTFTEADLGKTYVYTLKEKNTAVKNVSYSEVEYAIAVTLSLNSSHQLVAEIRQDGKAVTEVVAGFENVYDYTPPQTGDSENPVLWIALLILSAAGLSLQVVRKKRGAKA